MILTKAAICGLKDMAASASSGTAADLGMAEHGKAADRAWAGVLAAIEWCRSLRAGRDVVLVLSPAEAAALGEAAGRGLAAADGQTASQQRNGYAAQRKLTDALIAYGEEKTGRPERFQQPAEAIQPAEPEIDGNRPLCTMCGERNVAETGDLCDDCRAAWDPKHPNYRA